MKDNNFEEHFENDELIKNKIKEEAEKIQVPESLSPENMEKKLTRPKIYIPRRLVACLAFLLVFSTCIFTLARYSFSDLESQKAGGDSEIINDKEEGTSYEKLSQLINEYNKVDKYEIDQNGHQIEPIPEEENVEGVKIAKNAQEVNSDDGSLNNGVRVGDSTKISKNSNSTDAAKESGGDYSETDIQVKGVMEADIVKTNGKYIFTADNLTGACVKIYSVSGPDVEEIQTIEEDDDSNILEMYLEGNKLVIIYNNINRSSSYKNEKYNNRYAGISLTTKISVYDISDEKNPKLVSKHEQDGAYMTSRVADNQFYLFTNYTTYNNECKKDQPESFVPSIDGNLVEEKNISIADESKANSYMLMTSLSLDNSNDYIDKKVVFGASNNFYMSNDNIYLIKNYSREAYKTIIRKYSYKEGKFKYITSAKVSGEISNSYYMHEYKGNFVYVYTNYGQGGKTENGLCILDENLKEKGSLTGLGKNENIKSSYYIENMAYFVTYRQTDPVFAVDISDPNKPVLKSELKLPGFSSYLHSLGENVLLGIGSGGETDNSIKLSIFSIDENKILKEKCKKIFEDDSYSIAGDNHKAVFIDEERGLIGFAAMTYDYENGQNGLEYNVFTYSDGKIEKCMSCPIQGDYSRIDGLRGLRIGNYFYVVNVLGKIEVYNMNNWQKEK